MVVQGREDRRLRNSLILRRLILSLLLLLLLFLELVGAVQAYLVSGGLQVFRIGWVHLFLFL